MRAADVVGRKIVGVIQRRRPPCPCVANNWGGCDWHKLPWEVFGFELDNGGWLQITGAQDHGEYEPNFVAEATYHPPKKETR